MEIDQALAAFHYAAEEMRFYRSHEWSITNYAVLAYAALAAVPYAVGRCSKWHIWLSGFAAVLVVLAAVQAMRTLWYSNDVRVSERGRLVEALEHLPDIRAIQSPHPRTEPSQRPPGVRKPSWFPDLPLFPYGLGAVVVLGASLASLIILSQIGRVRDRWVVAGVMVVVLAVLILPGDLSLS